MDDILIRLKNVSWYYENFDKPALSNIDLSINRGEFILVLGENGSGKSTFCRLLNGLIPHSIKGRLTGAVEIDGVSTKNSTVADLSKKVGMVFDDASNQLFTTRVFDETAFGPENLMLDRETVIEKVNDALNAVGLSSFLDHHPLKLSGGQKQRLAIAAALAMADSILVMDEPESQLDPIGARDVFSYIAKLHSSRGITIIMAVNFADELIKYADRIIVLNKGRLEAFDTPLKIFQNRKLLSECGIHIPHVCEFALCKEDEILKIKDLCFSYTPGIEILKNINFSVYRNEFIVIAGLNGSGKTTLMNILSGLLRPGRGSILLNQKDHSNMSLTEIAAEIGYVMQECDSQLFMPTVYNEIASCIRSSVEKEKHEITENLLKITGLLEKRDIFPPKLSRTDRFKTVFASVLAMGSKILLLDEPFAGQDSRGCRIIIDILKNARKDGYTILLVTHNINIVSEYAERYILFDNGEIILDGTIQELRYEKNTFTTR